MIVEGYEVSNELAEIVSMAAKGYPYIILVQENVPEKKGAYIYSHNTNGFDVAYLFSWLRDMANEDPEFKKILPDLIIELSKCL